VQARDFPQGVGDVADAGATTRCQSDNVAIFNRQSRPTTLCIRCEARYAASSVPYCTQCGFLVRAEVAAGLQRFARYLEAWAAFDAWCVARGEGARAL
jgi:hypothetical protein